MSSIFDLIRSQVGALAAQHFDQAQLYKVSRSETAGGSVTQLFAAPVAVWAMQSELSEGMRQSPGYTSRDIGLIIARQDITEELSSDDEVLLGGVRYRLGTPITLDPAGAGWTARGTPV